MILIILAWSGMPRCSAGTGGAARTAGMACWFHFVSAFGPLSYPWLLMALQARTMRAAICCNGSISRAAPMAAAALGIP